MGRLLGVVLGLVVRDAVDAAGRSAPQDAPAGVDHALVTKTLEEKYASGDITQEERDAVLGKLRDFEVEARVPDSPPARNFRVALAGDSITGKTACFVTMRGLTPGPSAQMGTEGVDMAVVRLVYDLPSGPPTGVKLLLADMSGKDRYRAITRAEFQKADGFLVFYSDMDEESFAAVTDPHTSFTGQKVPSWLEDTILGGRRQSMAPMVLVAHSHSQSVRRDPAVLPARGQEIAAGLAKAAFHQTGCRDQASVDALLSSLAVELLRATGDAADRQLADDVEAGHTRWRA